MIDCSPIIETLKPADAVAVAEAVRNAAGRKIAVYPLGGGTSWNGSYEPTQTGVGISLANLTRVIDYPADDLTITVEAGMTIAELGKLLAAKRQRLPVDVPHPERATVGGAIATNAAGPRRFAYGTMRDYVLGFTAVDGRGTLFSGGGRVVKNAAGYNMCRLLAGSFGTLGIITQATLMVRPACEASVFLVCDVPTFEAAERLLSEMIHLPIRPAAVEFLAGQLSPNEPMLGPMLDGHVGRLYVGFEGLKDEVDWMVEQLRGAWIASGATEPVLVPTVRAESLWRWLTETPGGARFNVLPGKTVEKVVELLKIDPACSIQAHAGDGVIHTTMSNAVGKAADGDGGTNANVSHRVMRALKDRFDPENLLNPGRLAF